MACLRLSLSVSGPVYVRAFPIDSDLPSVMRWDDTPQKLLGVYQSLYINADRELAWFPERLSPQGPDPLPELHRWLGASSWMGLACRNGRC